MGNRIYACIDFGVTARGSEANAGFPIRSAAFVRAERMMVEGDVIALEWSHVYVALQRHGVQIGQEWT